MNKFLSCILVLVSLSGCVSMDVGTYDYIAVTYDQTFNNVAQAPHNVVNRSIQYGSNIAQYRAQQVINKSINKAIIGVFGNGF